MKNTDGMRYRCRPTDVRFYAPSSRIMVNYNNEFVINMFEKRL